MESAGCRRLCALVFQLPSGSALAHSAEQHWTVADEIAAAQLEVGHAQWLQLRALRGDKSVGQVKPLQVPRPWQPVSRETADGSTGMKALQREAVRGGDA